MLTSDLSATSKKFQLHFKRTLLRQGHVQEQDHFQEKEEGN